MLLNYDIIFEIFEHLSINTLIQIMTIDKICYKYINNIITNNIINNIKNLHKNDLNKYIKSFNEIYVHSYKDLTGDKNDKRLINIIKKYTQNLPILIKNIVVTATYEDFYIKIYNKYLYIATRFHYGPYGEFRLPYYFNNESMMYQG